MSLYTYTTFSTTGVMVKSKDEPTSKLGLQDCCFDRLMGLEDDILWLEISKTKSALCWDVGRGQLYILSPPSPSVGRTRPPR